MLLKKTDVYGVRLHVTLTYCIHTAVRYHQTVSRQDSPTSLVFRDQAPLYRFYFQENPSAGPLNKRGFRKIRSVQPIPRYVSETARGYYGTLIGSHSYPIDLCQFR